MGRPAAVHQRVPVLRQDQRIYGLPRAQGLGLRFHNTVEEMDYMRRSYNTALECPTLQVCVQDDAWEYSWTGRTGIPLSHFRNRWDGLNSYDQNAMGGS
ncbi:hypothetical protein N7501_009896 [Penicillium viridicatum]|nr:hypothetical protein N7501_009896 [Penicillium viridicatum]